MPKTFSTKTADTVRKWIEIDTKYNRTYDMTKLRYTGSSGIPVFFWDALVAKDTFDSVLSYVSAGDETSLVHPTAVTKNKYVPWYNVGESSDVFSSYCLEEYEDLDFLKIPEYTKGIPYQLEGKVYNVSLKAIQELDMFYENGETFNRTIIEVFPSKYYKQPKFVWAYFNDVDQIATFDTATQEYLLDKDIDPTLFNDRADVNGTYYNY